MLHHLFMSNKVGQEHVVGHGGTSAVPHRGWRNGATGACSPCISMYLHIVHIVHMPSQFIRLHIQQLASCSKCPTGAGLVPRDFQSESMA